MTLPDAFSVPSTSAPISVRRQTPSLQASSEFWRRGGTFFRLNIGRTRSSHPPTRESVVGSPSPTSSPDLPSDQQLPTSSSSFPLGIGLPSVYATSQLPSSTSATITSNFFGPSLLPVSPASVAPPSFSSVFPLTVSRRFLDVRPRVPVSSVPSFTQPPRLQFPPILCVVALHLSSHGSCHRLDTRDLDGTPGGGTVAHRFCSIVSTSIPPPSTRHVTSQPRVHQHDTSSSLIRLR